MPTLSRTAIGQGIGDAVDSLYFDPVVESAKITGRAFSTTTTNYGQTFLPSRELIVTAARFLMRRVGSPSGNVGASITQHTGTFGSSGVPTGSSMWQGSVIASTIPTSWTWVTLPTTSISTLHQGFNSNDPYCVFVSHNSSTATNYVEVASVSHVHNGNGFSFSSPTYTAQSYDIPFQVIGSTGLMSLGKPRGYDRPQLVAEGSVSAVTAGSLTVNLPAHQTNDILIAIVSIYAPNSASWSNLTTPSGWTLYGTSGTPSVANGEHAIYWRRATSNSTADPVFVRGASWDDGTDTCFAGRAFVVRNCRTSISPFTTTSPTFSTVTTAARPTITWLSGTVSPATNDLQLLFYVGSGVRSAGALTNTISQSPSALFATAYWSMYNSASTSVGTGATFKTAWAATNQNNLNYGQNPSTAQALGSQPHLWINTRLSAAAASVRAEGWGASDAVDFFNPPAAATSQETLGTTYKAVSQSFTGDDTTISGLKVQLWRSGTPTGNVTAEIWSHQGTYGSSSRPLTLLATSETVVDSATLGTTRGVEVNFRFSGANRVTTVNGTRYCFVIRFVSGNTSTVNIAAVQITAGVQISHSGNFARSTDGTVFSAVSSQDAWFVVLHHNQPSPSITVQRTATGSGLGTETTVRLVVRRRSATGSGLGTETAARNVSRVRSATGSGLGTETAARRVTRLRSASGSGAGTQTNTQRRTRIRSATGAGTGTSANAIRRGIYRNAQGSGVGSTAGTAVGRLTPVRTATGSGVGSQTATRLVRRQRSATSSGIGSETAVRLVRSQRSASGDGVGTATAIKKRTVSRTGDNSGVGSATALKLVKRRRFALGLGFGTADPLATVRIGPVRTASGGGSSDSTAAGRITRYATAVGSGEATQTASGQRIVFRSASGQGNSAAITAIRHLLFRNGVGSGQGSTSGLVTTLRTVMRTATGQGDSSQTTQILRNINRTAAASGESTSIVTSRIIRAKSAFGAGFSMSFSTEVRIVPRTGLGDGSGSAAVVKVRKVLRTATGAGVGQQGTTVRRGLVRSGVGTGQGSTNDTAVGRRTLIRNGSGAGNGTATATKMVVRKRSGSGDGTGTSFCLKRRTAPRNGAANGFGSANNLQLRSVFKTGVSGGFGDAFVEGVRKLMIFTVEGEVGASGSTNTAKAVGTKGRSTVVGSSLKTEASGSTGTIEAKDS